MNLKPKPKPEEEKNDELTFEKWAIAKYHELKRQVNPCDENGKLDPQRLNEVLTVFAQNFGWAITMQEVESNKMHQLQHEYDRWYKGCYNVARRTCYEEQGGATRAPSIATIEAKIVQIFPEIEQRQSDLQKQKSRVDLLRGFVRVLERQASILQTLSSNMRSELFFSGGITASAGESTSTARRVADTKITLRAAMKKDDAEGS